MKYVLERVEVSIFIARAIIRVTHARALTARASARVSMRITHARALTDRASARM